MLPLNPIKKLISLLVYVTFLPVFSILHFSSSLSIELEQSESVSQNCATHRILSSPKLIMQKSYSFANTLNTLNAVQNVLYIVSKAYFF